MAKTEYTRVLSGFGGIDITSDDSNVAITRFPYLVNMWRDFRSENGAAIETFPGWRLIPWRTSYDGKINGLYGATFGAEKYLLIHKGAYLYAQAIKERNTDYELAYIGIVADARSKGFQHGEAYYILDTETIWRITYSGSGFKISEVGMSAYIPTTYADGLEYEQRNMLTNEFYAKYNIHNPEETAIPDDGLVYEVLNEEAKTAIVTGMTREIKNLYVPNTCMINGKEYTVRAIGQQAFSGDLGKSIETAVISPNVENIGTGDTIKYGPFYDCERLRRVVLHGAISIDSTCFAGCKMLTEIIIAGGLLSAPKSAFPAQTGFLYIYFGGTLREASEAGLDEWNGGSNEIITDAKIYYGKVGDTVTVRYSTAGSTEVKVQEQIFGINASNAYSYQFKSSPSEGLAIDITTKERIGTLWLKLVGASPETNIIITATDDVGAINSQEGALSHYRFDLYEPTKEIKTVTLNGKTASYVTFTETVDDKVYIRSIVLTSEKNALEGKELIVHAEAYDSEFARSEAGEDYKYGNASYNGTSADAIKKCTIYAEYDGRIFLSGNPNLPNTVFYSNRNLSGVNDPTYFGQLNYFNDGQGMTPNASLLSTPSFLAVIKRDTSGEGTVYYHTAEATEYDVLPKIYPSVQGAANVGSLGPATNFRDDPVFISSGGLEGISLSAVNSERGVYHRSTNVDKWLLAELQSGKAEITEWEGYLAILVNGKMFLADSRQIAKINGTAQYEWYFVDDVGYYEGQQKAYYFPSTSPYDTAGNKLTDLYVSGYRLEVKSTEDLYTGYPDQDTPTTDQEGSNATKEPVYFVKEEDESGALHYYIVSSYGEMGGGEYSPATAICNVGDLLVFGTESGRICVVNTDKRGEAVGTDEVPRDRIHPLWYTRCDRRYIAGFATKKDNCDIPHYDKDTVRRSLVIKAKTLAGSKFAIKVRSDREPWQDIQDSTAAFSSAYDVDFANASFLTSEETIRQLRETTRRWVEKQYYVYSDEFRRPFGIYSIAFRYQISGLNGRIRRT